VWLFELASDPEERSNLAEKHPDLVESSKNNHDPLLLVISGSFF
jgi:hypothetical protein